MDMGQDTVMPRLTEARIARLATVSSAGDLHLVPVCFAVVDGRIVSAVDHKPKRTTRLRRLDDIRETGRAVVLVDHYDEDWSQLWWIRVSGAAVVHDEREEIDRAARHALVQKYGQYRDVPPDGPVWSVRIDSLRTWSASLAP